MSNCSSSAILLHAEAAVRRHQEYKNCLSQISNFESLLSETQANLLLSKTKKISKNLEKHVLSKKNVPESSIDSSVFSVTNDAKLLIEKLSLEATSRDSQDNSHIGFTTRFSKLCSP